MFCACVLLLGVTACARPAAPSTTTPPPEVKMPPNFLVVYRRGPAWIVGKSVREQPLKDHGRYLIDLYKRGILKFAGPFLDDTGGAAALLVETEDAAKAIVAADPGVTSGVMIPELHAWKLVGWEAFIKK
jgi:uncharacterized protein YciI